MPNNKVIISIHGIRTRGAWQKNLSMYLSRAGFIYDPYDYGWFSAVLLLFPWSRDREVEKFRDYITHYFIDSADAQPSVIAHSFGSYLLARAMDRYEELRFDRIILCGSIVRRDYPWKDRIAKGRVEYVLNDYGYLDTWTALAEWLINDAGASGVRGFEPNYCSAEVFQRSHTDFRHSDYFYSLNYEKVWVPFLLGNNPSELESSKRPINWKFRSLQFLFILVIAVIIGLQFRPDDTYGLRLENLRSGIENLSNTIRFREKKGGGFGDSVRAEPWTSAQALAALGSAATELTSQPDLVTSQPDLVKTLQFLQNNRMEDGWGRFPHEKEGITEVTAWAGLAYIFMLKSSSQLQDDAMKRSMIDNLQKAYHIVLDRQNSSGGWSSFNKTNDRQNSDGTYTTFIASLFLLKLSQESTIRSMAGLESTGDIDSSLSSAFDWILTQYKSGLKGWEERTGEGKHKDLTTLFLLILTMSDSKKYATVRSNPDYHSALNEWLTQTLRESKERPPGDIVSITQKQYRFIANHLEAIEQTLNAKIIWYPWTLLLVNKLAIDEKLSLGHAGIMRRFEKQLWTRIGHAGITRKTEEQLWDKLEQAIGDFRKGDTYIAAEALFALGEISRNLNRVGPLGKTH